MCAARATSRDIVQHVLLRLRLTLLCLLFNRYAALGRMFADFAVQCTWEGDNTVMALQTARYLVNCYEKVKRRERVNGTVS